MKHSKKKLLTAAAAIAAVALLVLVVWLGEKSNSRYAPEDTTPTKPQLLDPSQNATESPIPTIDVSEDLLTIPDPKDDSITVTINPAIKNAEIDRSPDVSSDHPEYVESYLGGGRLNSREGKVYKNDRDISIDVQNAQTGEWTTYTFGLSLGKYNRFLYLNPKRNTGNPDTKGYFHFQPASGFVLDLSQTYKDQKEMLAMHDNFTVRRAMDQLAVANYVDPMYPGVVWYTNHPLDGPTYIDVISYHGQGSIAALLRIWIDKDENGCYYIVTIEDQNLYLKNHPTFTTGEIYHIYKMVDSDILDDELVGMQITDEDWGVEDYYYDYRESGTGPYYQYFIPANSATGAASKDYRENNIMAVTLRYNGVSHSITLYYQIIAMPFGENHGVYRYMGRDYHYNATIKDLQNVGYPGYD